MINACKSAAEATELSKNGQDMFNEIEALKTPVVAAIMGTALGGGLEVYFILPFFLSVCYLSILIALMKLLNQLCETMLSVLTVA
jgi:hypothetical protein